MSKRVTFFYNHKVRSGETLYLSSKDDVREGEIFLYSSGPLPSADIHRLKESHDANKAGSHKLAARLIEFVGEDGIVIHSMVKDDRGHLEIFSTNANQRSSRCVVLRPGYPPQMVDIGENGRLPLPKGSRVVYPVNLDAQEQLAQFLENLSWFPQDLESLVLNTLWRPGLDLRLDRVEKELGIGREEIAAKPVEKVSEAIWWLKNFVGKIEASVHTVTCGTVSFSGVASLEESRKY